jgi:hypothetical protein
MKPFAVWASAVVVAFAALAGVTTATRDTEQVFVVVDSSFFMEGLLSRVPSELDRIDDRDYAEFALATLSDRTKESIHGYQPDFDYVVGDAFAPCSFEDIDGFTEASSADEGYR